MHFSVRQKKLLTLCVAAYTVLYLCRLNLSAALDAITQDLGISLAAAGMLQTIFAVVYACGQVVNGSIVDHVNPFRYMITGLAGAAVCNLFMSFTVGYEMMIAAWACNAVFQSMLWTPIVRVVARVFVSERERNTANAALAVTLIAGHFFAWAISGVMAGRYGWRLSFRVPGVIALITSAVIYWLLRRESAAPEWNQNRRAAKKKASGGAGVLSSVSFLLVLGTCILYGFIRDGVVTWTPTILNQIGGGEAVTSTAFSLILPLINISGVITGFTLRRRGARPHGVAAALMALAVVCAPVLMLTSGMLQTAVLLGLICAGMYGANTMLTALIPLEYNCVGKTGMTAGLIDSVIYAGSALAGVFGGSIYETLGRNTLYGTWAAAGLASVALMTAAGRMSARYWRAHRNSET